MGRISPFLTDEKPMPSVL